MYSVIVITLDISVFPSDQEINSYPSSAVAVRVTSVPSWYSPDPVTVPPSPVSVKVYTGINSNKASIVVSSSMVMVMVCSSEPLDQETNL